MRWSLKKVTISELEAIYEEAAANQWQAILGADARTANRHYRRIVAAWQELRSRGPEGRAALSRLMQSGNLNVRAWAASHVLEFDPRAAEAELERLANGPPSMVRLDAEMTLAEWRAGRLSFDDA